MRAVAEDYDCELWARCHLLDAHLARSDAYNPSLALIVTETISEQAEETITVMWDFAVGKAREETTRN